VCVRGICLLFIFLMCHERRSRLINAGNSQESEKWLAKWPMASGDQAGKTDPYHK